jgi:dienelactone hydrolase
LKSFYRVYSTLQPTFKRSMRIGEILIIVADLAALATFVRRPLWFAGTAAIVLLVVLIHLFVEQSHWQMIPAYMASIAIVVCGFEGIASTHRVITVICVLSAAMLLASVVLAIALPVFSLPRPSGPYPIGTVFRAWSRIHSDRESSKPVQRRLTVQFWYPAQTATGKRSSYRAEVGQGLKSHLRLVRTHSFVNAPILSSIEKLPVVLFSPGWKGHLTQNSVQFEMLASHGFVVVSVEHPPAEKLPADFDPSLEENLERYPLEARLRAEDISFVIDQLANSNCEDAGSLFASRLDTSRVGMFGYSFGGAVAAEACWLDDRLKAGINMDGMMFGEAADAGVAQPFFFMSCDGPLPSEDDLQCPDPRKRLHMQMIDLDIRRIHRSLARYGGYYLTIRGSAHSNYSDRPLYSPLKKLTDAGSIDVMTAFDIVNNYALAFFDQYLNGNRQDLLEQQSGRYPDADFECHPISVAVSSEIA